MSKMSVPPIIKPFGDYVILFGIPLDIPVPAGCVRGEELADLEQQMTNAADSEFLRSIGIGDS